MKPDASMSLAEHLGELRSRLLKCVLAVAVLGAATLVFARPLFALLMRPVLEALPAEARALVYTSGIEEINVLMKVGIYAGIFLTTPVILWQLWGFIAPGLMPEERKMAAPFVVLGSMAFIAGATFCYFVILPSMFQFLLQEPDTAALEGRVEAAERSTEAAERFLRLGDPETAARLGRAAQAALGTGGDGQPREAGAAPEGAVESAGRLSGFGRLLDAAADGYGATVRGPLRQAAERHAQAAEAHAAGDLRKAGELLDEGAALLAGVAPTRSEELSALWRLEKSVAAARGQHAQADWTRPMLTMNEQLGLVLVLLLAFGVIFELPIVLALLGSVGLVTSRFLFKYQRHAFVVCLIAAAIITPTGDVVNLSLMAGPMLLCYELGVLAVWLLERRRARREKDDAGAIRPAA